MGYQLGIDLGTTFTAAAVNRNGNVEIVTLGSRAGAVPTAVLVREDGSHVHGETAAHRGMSDPDRVVKEFKRRLGDARSIRAGDQEVTVEQLTTSFLRWVVDLVSERQGSAPDRIVLTHPANWGEHKMEAINRAIDGADIGDVDLVPEPLAAAIRYASQSRVEEGSLVTVYDLGGGTFDVTILRKRGDGFELVGRPEGVEYLGGIDFDEAIFYRVKMQLGTRYTEAGQLPGFPAANAALRRECRDAKEALSVESEVVVPVLLPGISENVVISRSDFEGLIRPSIEESIAATRRCLRNAGIEASEISHLLLVGGSSRVPMIRQMLEQNFVLNVAEDTDPKYSVAEGAALYSPASFVSATDQTAATPTSPLAPAAPPTAPMAPPAHTQSAAAASAPGAPTAPVAPTPAPAATPGPSGAPAPTGNNSSGLDLRILAGVGALLLLLAGGAFFALRGGGDDDNIEAATENGDIEVAGDTQTAEEDPEAGIEETADDGPLAVSGASGLVAPEIPSAENMVEIGGGNYEVGLDGGDDDHASARSVEVTSFYIDGFEVTNAAYAALVERGEVQAPASWTNGEAPEGFETHPVRGVTIDDARLFCSSLGKRLPGEAEWEIAARGGAGRLFPWGNDAASVDLGTGELHQVGSRADTFSPEGVADLVGNVWEWVDEPYEAVPEGSAVLRGGANGLVRDGAYRLVGGADNATMTAEAGFRCAADEVDNREDELAADEVDTAAAEELAATGLLVDEFLDPDSGWPIEEGDNYIRGYHPPDFYHVEARGQGARVLAPRGVNFADVEVTTNVEVDHTDTVSESFRYGLLFRAEGIDYYSFTINPREGTWEVVHDDSLGFRAIAEGEATNLAEFGEQDELKVRLEGSTMTFFLNGVELTRLDTGGHHLRGDIGFFVENYEESLAHVHYENIFIEAIESDS